MKLSLALVLGAMAAWPLVAADEFPKDAELQLRHDYKLTVKTPFFYLDNRTIPFYEHYGASVPSNDYIRIVPSMPHVKGSLWSREKNTHSEWLAQLKIRISGPGHIGGEGFAFWYTKDRGAPPYILAEKYPASVDPSGHALGPVYGALDQWNGLAVMFDTFDEKTGRRNNPLVLGMLNDGKMRLADQEVPEARAFGHCALNYRNSEHEVTVKVLYRRHTVQVWTSGWDGQTNLCFERSGIVLPSDYYFGVSASTGDRPDDHDLYSLDIHEVGSKIQPHKSSHHHDLTNHEKERFEEVQHKVEEARAAHHDINTQHDKQELDRLAVDHLKETQFKIIEHLEKMVDLIKTSGGGSLSSSSDSVGDLSEVKQDLKQLREKVDRFEKSLSEMYQLLIRTSSYLAHDEIGGSRGNGAEAQRLNSLLNELSSKVDAVHVRTHRLGEQTAAISDNHFSPWLLLILFFFGQGLLMFAYGLARKKPQEKKFI